MSAQQPTMVLAASVFPEVPVVVVVGDFGQRRRWFGYKWIDGLCTVRPAHLTTRELLVFMATYFGFAPLNL